MGRKELIDEIERIEWGMFSTVNNIGGKASCQNDPEQFSIMRRASYVAWDEELLQSYLDDLHEAQDQGVNLMAEKYARMMQVTMPDSIEMDPIPKTLMDLMDEAYAIIMEWESVLYERFPLLKKKARNLNQFGDEGGGISDTAFDTYLFGEMSIYSEKTLRLYVRLLKQQLADDVNGSLLIYDDMAKAQGWASFEQANQALVVRKEVAGEQGCPLGYVRPLDK